VILLKPRPSVEVDVLVIWPSPKSLMTRENLIPANETAMRGCEWKEQANVQVKLQVRSLVFVDGDCTDLGICKLALAIICYHQVEAITQCCNISLLDEPTESTLVTRYVALIL
jgi:hypothetical protein